MLLPKRTSRHVLLTFRKRTLVLSTFLSIATLTGLTLSQLTLQPAHAITPPDSCFAFDSGTGTITDYYDNENNDPLEPACPRAVDIPATISGITVTTIGGGAFGNKALTAVTIPNTVVVINGGAFYNNLLIDIDIPDSVTTIASGAFISNQLAGSLVIPDSVTTIGGGAFANNQLTSIVIPHSVTSLQPAFSGNPITSATIAAPTIPNGLLDSAGLTSLILEEGVETIQSAFSSSQLTSLTIPNTVTHIRAGAFAGSKLTSLVIYGDALIEGGAFHGCQLTSLIIHDNPYVQNSAFGSNNLTSVTILGNPTLGLNAFGFNGLSKSTIPPGLTDIQLHDYYQQNASLVRIYATDPDFITANIDSFVVSTTCTGPLNSTPPCYSYIVSGYLLNPASIAIHYLNSSNDELSTTLSLISSTPNSIPDYKLSHILDTTDPDNPTLNFASGNYYRIGDTVTLASENIPTIAGYITPALTGPLVLNALANTHNFVYYTQAELDEMSAGDNSDGSTNGADTLSDTGVSFLILSAGGAGMLLVGFAVLRREALGF